MCLLLVLLCDFKATVLLDSAVGLFFNYFVNGLFFPALYFFCPKLQATSKIQLPGNEVILMYI